MKAAEFAFYYTLIMFDPSLFHTFSFVAIFIASIAGSLHCVGMCGGLVGLAGSSSRGPMMGQLGYHVGRGCGYLTLGAVAGAFGEMCTSIVRAILIPHSPLGGLVTLAALLVISLGIYQFNSGRGESLVQISGASVLGRLRNRLIEFPFALGVCTALLPCPWLYSFVLLAAAAGDALSGAQVMTAFWLGTIPALLVVGTIFEAAVRVFLKRYPIVSVVAVMLAFAFSIGAHLMHVHGGGAGSKHDHAMHLHP